MKKRTNEEEGKDSSTSADWKFSTGLSWINLYEQRKNKRHIFEALEKILLITQKVKNQQL